MELELTTEQQEEILKNEITEDDYQYTEKGYEPKYVTRAFQREFDKGIK